MMEMVSLVSRDGISFTDKISKLKNLVEEAPLLFVIGADCFITARSSCGLCLSLCVYVCVTKP